MMPPQKKTEVGVKLGFDNVEGNIAREIIQEVVTFKVGDFKIIPHLDGKGETWVYRTEDSITAMTRRYEKDGILARGLHSEVESFVIRNGEVVFNGRKL